MDKKEHNITLQKIQNMLFFMLYGLGISVFIGMIISIYIIIFEGGLLGWLFLSVFASLLFGFCTIIWLNLYIAYVNQGPNKRSKSRYKKK